MSGSRRITSLRCVVILIGVLQLAAIAPFAYWAILTDDSWHIAQDVGLLLTAPFALLTVPAIYLSLRTRWTAAGVLLTAISLGVMVVLWHGM